MKSELEVSDDPINDSMILDKGDDFHLGAALRAEERINFIRLRFILHLILYFRYFDLI